MPVINPPADLGTVRYQADVVPAYPDGTHGPVTFGLFSKAHLGERLFWQGREYAVTAVRAV